MVFNANLVAVIKHKGRILRETRVNTGSSITNDRVYIPFGAEYSILLKNLHTRKALVTVEIDGREAISDLIVHPNSNVELERFFEGNMNKGHKFKFIEKTDDIREYRGDKVEDGIIRITYQFEQPSYWYKTTPNIWDLNIDSNPWWPKRKKWGELYDGDLIWEDTSKTVLGSSTPTYTNINSFVDNQQMQDQIRSFNYCSQENEDGITVEGDYSNQSFSYGHIDALDPEVYCINIEMKGHQPNKGPVKKPVTVKTKLKCDYCGKMNRSRNKFCPNCGAALI